MYQCYVWARDPITDTKAFMCSYETKKTQLLLLVFRTIY